MSSPTGRDQSQPPTGPSTHPPGQAITGRFPVVGEREPVSRALDLSTWTLEVAGEVEHPLTLSYTEILALPQEELVADIHCVTGWTHLGMRLQGTRLRHLLHQARPMDDARFIRFIAWSPRDHDTSQPLSLAMDDTWLIHSRDGKPLEPEHGFPLRTVTPSRYFFKSLKWLRRIELISEDKLGFWERESNYHNIGDPWPGDQRFTSGSLPPDRLERLRTAADLTPWRGTGKVLLGVSLKDWKPEDRDLRGIQMKNCDLRGADLAGADLRSANFSLSDLRGADLRGSDLREADLEGANLAGANLTAADMRGALLTATRLFELDPSGEPVKARLTGARTEGVSGLLEDQEFMLSDQTESESPE